MRGLYSRFRSASNRKILLFSVAASAVIVLLALHARREGGRSAQFAWIPLRPPTAREAAALLSAEPDISRSCSALAYPVALEPDTAYIGTSQFLVPFPEGEVASTFRFKGKTYNSMAATWENYYLVHPVNRKELEKELGRRLAASDLRPECFAGEKMSFNSGHIWRYALIETAFLALVIASALLIAARIKTVWWFFPLILIPQVVIFFFVPLYSPAFVDADYFMQRIVVEVIWVMLLFGLPFFTFAMAVISVPALALRSLGGALEARNVMTKKAYIKMNAVFLAVLVCLAGAWEGRLYLNEEKSAEAALARMTAAAGAREIEAIRASAEYVKNGDVPPGNMFKSTLLKSEAKAAMEKLFKGINGDGPRIAAAFVHVEGNKYIFMTGGEGDIYANYREVENTYTMPEPEAMRDLARSGAYSSGFVSYLTDLTMFARSINDPPGHPGAIFVIYSDKSPKYALTPIHFLSKCLLFKRF